jgi:hypothetical protein
MHTTTSKTQNSSKNKINQNSTNTKISHNPDENTKPNAYVEKIILYAINTPPILILRQFFSAESLRPTSTALLVATISIVFHL